MRLLIMGPQGVGKGTQAALLSKRYGIPAISTGDIFRYNLKNQTPLGVQAQTYMDKGQLVPDDLTNRIVEDRLGMDDVRNGWILDGYPRTIAQVHALDDMLAQMDQQLDHVIALEASREVLFKRMEKRAKEEGRPDDTPAAIRERLETYDRETAPLLDVFEQRGKLLSVDGVGEVDEINQRIIQGLS
ncbi:adenylate kinase [Bifidobacterium aemilianum]|uniref:Adenylate kinase n=1 Tax=Bifidobacterium aemilianum TaxID=2493120 RepID=A0A366K792_9BIFI|nr:adenylate kinase [Bifidobacterium aemilianum]RBP97549.1 adenylate kinase [Bifidobacterium aemilianum]